MTTDQILDKADKEWLADTEVRRYCCSLVLNSLTGLLALWSLWSCRVTSVLAERGAGSGTGRPSVAGRVRSANQTLAATAAHARLQSHLFAAQGTPRAVLAFVI